MGELERRPLSVLVTPSSDLPGQWVAHCLQLDIVSQGTSIEHAFDMICEACQLAMNEDLEEGHDPFEREAAPDEDWEPYYAIMKHGIPLSRVPAEKRSQLKAVGGEIVAVFYPREAPKPAPAPAFKLAPPAWQAAAALEALRSDRASAH